MRVVLGTRPAAIFGAVFVIALIAFLPMRLVTGALGLGDTGFTARSVSGSVWRGRFDEASFGALPLGDLHAGLSPFDLLIGRARIGLSPPGDGVSPQGALIVSRHMTGIDVTSASLQTGAVFAPLPVSQLDLSEVVIRFEDGVCMRATGRVRAATGGSVAGVDLGSGISGEARCEGGALMLPLASASGAERVALRITGAGGYHADLSIRPADPAAIQHLMLAGFRPTARGYTLSVDGSIR
jgi:general secretion pathway protein N